MPPGVKKKRRRRQKSRSSSHEPEKQRFLTDSSDSEIEEYSYDGKKKTGCGKLEKELGILLGVCLVIILSMAGVIVIQAINTRREPPDPACRTAECVQVAGRMMGVMDFTVDPCTDFYRYSCGNWIKHHIPPPNRPKYDVFGVIDDRNTAQLQKLLQSPPTTYHNGNSTALYKAHMYYKSCMNEEQAEERGAQPLLQLIKSFGSWNVTSDAVSGTWNDASWDFMKTMIETNKLGMNPFFGVGIGVNDLNSSQHIITFEQAGLSMSDKNQYTGNHSEKYHQAFLQYFTRISQLLGATDLTKANESAEEVWQFEKQMAQHFLPRSELQDLRKLYHNMTLEQIQQVLGGSGSKIQIERLIKGVFPDPVSMEEMVVIYTPEYLKQVGKIVQNTPQRILANYMIWHLVHSMSPYLSSQFRQAIIILKSVTKGVKTLSPTWERCVARTSNWLAFAVGGLYIQNNFEKDQKEQVLDILQRLIASLIDHFPKVTWMDKETQQRAIVKAEAISDMIGYPDWIEDPKKLDEYYAKMQFTGDDEFQNALNGLNFFVQKSLNKLRKPVDKKEWHMGPAEVNAYYSPAFNTIVFPAGVLQAPIYDKDAPMSVKFGALGMVMGHEMTHGFDNQGRLFDKDGNMVNWWGNQSAVGFAERVKCMIEQYDKYEVGSGHLNGDQTKGENIADNGGLKVALNAYHAWRANSKVKDTRLPGLNMTDVQQFFLGFSQVWCSYYTPEYAMQSLMTDIHSYAPHRVIGTLSNMKSFSEAYKCKAGDRMNASKKCVVW